MVGSLLKGQRHEWVLATKLGNKMSERVNEGHYSRTWMLREVDASLQRLQTDYLDILYLHRDFNGMDLEEPLRAIDALQRSGKIRYWGVSNFRGWRIAEAVRWAGQLGMAGPVVCQPYYNLLNRMPEVEVLPACDHYRIGVTPYSPVARGVLTGKYSPGQPPLAGSRAGPRTLAQWRDYLPALDYAVSPEDEALVDSLVRPGHPSTPGFSDPQYPLPARTRG